MKQQNEANNQVSGYNSAVGKQHKRPLSLSAVPSLGKRRKKKNTPGISLRILQLNIEGLTASKLDIVKRLALEDNVTIILFQETHCQSVRKLARNNYELAGCTLAGNMVLLFLL